MARTDSKFQKMRVVGSMFAAEEGYSVRVGQFDSMHNAKFREEAAGSKRRLVSGLL